MELVYVLVLEAKFCEFESHHPHQLWRVIRAGPGTVLKTDGLRKRLEFDSTIPPPNKGKLAERLRQRFAKPSLGNRWIGSIPIPSAIISYRVM